jgi:hypothetical protein
VFVIDGNSSAPIALNGSGQATFTTSTLTVGNHTVTVNYAGNASFEPSTGSLSGGQNVNKASTTTTIVSAMNPSTTGNGVDFVVTVASVAPATAVPTGTVNVLRDATALCTNLPLDATGKATCRLTFTAANTYSISAAFNGDANFNVSNSTPVSQVVTGPTLTTVTVSGRVTFASGNGMPRVFVTRTDSSMVSRRIMANQLGYYRFEGVTVGQTYTFTADTKQRSFTPPFITVLIGDVFADVNFVANP